MLRNISPHALAHASFCKPHDLRLWRQQGHLNGVGERNGKGHVFSMLEAVRIAASIRLARCNVHYSDAFDIVGKYGAQIDALSKAHPQIESCPDYILRVTMRPAFDDAIVRIENAPLARMTFELDELARAEVNLSSLVRSVAQRVASYQMHHAA